MPTSQNNKLNNIICNLKKEISKLQEELQQYEPTEINEIKAENLKLAEELEIEKMKNHMLTKNLKRREELAKKYKSSWDEEKKSKEFITKNYVSAEKLITFLCKECGTYKRACDTWLDFELIIEHDPDEYSKEYVEDVYETIEKLIEE